MNSSKRFFFGHGICASTRVRTCADSPFLTVPICLQTRTLGSDSRSRQSYTGRFWQFIDVHHWHARVHRLPIRCN
jgi:hypothetical protein